MFFPDIVYSCCGFRLRPDDVLSELALRVGFHLAGGTVHAARRS